MVSPFRFVPRVTRRASLALAAAALVNSQAHAAEPEVPIRLQVSLLDRVIPFDRNFSVRVHGKLSVLIVVDKSNEDSSRVGTQLEAELTTRETLGGYPLGTARVIYGGAGTLVDSCKRLRAGIVYLTPGVAESVAVLADALRGLRLLTVGSMPEQVTQGLVLGAAVRSAKPRVLVNLSRAHQQEVDFRADFLRMAEVVG
ncbi:MAG TPA: YfiR family protein [Polyangiaceae bacterium]|nr:YfiR family protein [Polyangiaceae bacterium]